MSKENKLWRVLIRVENIDYDSDKIMLIIPSWNLEKVIELSLSEFVSIHDIHQIYIGTRLFGYVNIGNNDINKLVIRNIEIAKKPTKQFLKKN